MTETDTRPRRGALRPVLWLLLVLSAAGNAGASFGGMSVALHTAFGVVTLLCAAALIMHHVRGRRRHATGDHPPVG
jgi:hypothetical protein